MSLWVQIIWLFVLAIPVATVAWTVTHEEVFRELREYCQRGSRECPKLWQRKFFYLFTCEYCFSHYATIFFLFFTGYKLLLEDWRGYVLAFFALVWMANLYMSLYARLRVDIRSERATADTRQKEAELLDRQKENLEVDLQRKKEAE